MSSNKLTDYNSLRRGERNSRKCVEGSSEHNVSIYDFF